ncbi:MAG: ABC transporter permease [Bacteroidota bacterium]|nr:ABC transporter permease [Bacteroidota bacterium]
MLRNYFKIAIRQLRKQKMYSAVKTGGFAMGIAACLLIALYIKEELSYDKSYPDAARIYRVVGWATENGTEEKWLSFPAPMTGAMLKDFPEVEKAGRLMPNNLFPGAGSNEVRPADKEVSTHEDGFTYADQSVLDILKIPMVYGDRAHALQEPNTVVISKSKADKYFPNQDPVGKILFLNNDKSKAYKIGGVMQDLPANSHLNKFNFLLSLAGIEWWPGEQSSWDANNYIDYILLRPGTNIARFEKKLTTGILQNYYLPSMLKSGDKNAEKELASASLHLQLISDINLYSSDIKSYAANLQDGSSQGDIRFIWLFGAIACFILMIACINFINLSTAKSANRAKEVGLRKVIGSRRNSLIKQFLTESLLYSFLSFALGIVLAWALLPYFNMLSDKSLTIPWTAWWLIPIMVLSATVIGLVAGIYPAFYLSSFQPIQVLKGQLSRGSKNSILRNGLVIFQFSTSIVLIVSTVVVYSQMHFILNKKLGYNKEQVLMLEGANTLGASVSSFKTALLKLPAVQSVSVSDFLPIAGTKRNGNSFWNEGKQHTDIGIDCQFWVVDNDYIKTMGMKMVAGRNFSPGMQTDSQAVIINQTLAEKLNLKDPIGKRIANGGATFPVIGVVQDFNFESLRDPVGGLVMHLGSSPSIVSVKINTGDMSHTIASIASVWKNFSPGQPMRYRFLDESFAAMYADVQRMAGIFTSFAVLAVIIACLGLFGLSAFMAEQRSKEIGVRKVLGATASSITALMSKDFLKLVIIAILIASPIAWWAMSKWLQDFAYRVPIDWWIFVLAGGTAVVIALFTVSFQSVKAAMSNPVDSLRSE